MAMRPHPRGRSAAQQGFALSAGFPDSSVTLRAGRLIWMGKLTPSPVSRGYSVRIDYDGRAAPRVRVLSPKLEGRNGEGLPHVYNDGTLCLHLPEDWARTMSIADTVVPWTSEWLAFYEVWRATGEWHGGGEWPPRHG